MKSNTTRSKAATEGERARRGKTGRGWREGGDGGRQQVVVMHRATFLATLISNKGLRVIFSADGEKIRSSVR